MGENNQWCDGKGLKMALVDAISEMDKNDADGFDYVIGEVKGMKLRIVAEPEGSSELVVIDGPMNYIAVAGW